MLEPINLDPKKCVLILNDMINRLFKGLGPPFTNRPEREHVLENCIKLLAHCRAVGTPVIFITTHYSSDLSDLPTEYSDRATGIQDQLVAGVPGTEFIDEIKVEPHDHILVKKRWSGFYGTDLDIYIRSRGIETLILGGVGTHRTIEGTARDAKNRDIRTIVVSDCCTAAEVDVSDMTLKYVLPLMVYVRTTDEVIVDLK